MASSLDAAPVGLADRACGALVRARVAVRAPLRPSTRAPERAPPTVSDAVRIVGACAEVSYRDFIARGDVSRALADHLCEPIIVRGGAAMWRARAWTLEGLVREFGAWRCVTRVNASTSTGRAFTYVESAHVDVIRGAFDAPSTTIVMPFASAVARVLRWHGNGGYVQSDVTSAMSAMCLGGASEVFSSVPGWRESQKQRLWLALSGSVSSMHFDASISTLTQVGNSSKRMLLYPPDALRLIGLWPNSHPLRRRGKVDLASDELERDFPAFVEHAMAFEAVIHPGDVLIFPPRWAHYTESLGDDVSMSITQRFRQDRAASSNACAKWLKYRHTPNALSRLVSCGLVKDDVGAKLPRDASTGECAQDVGGWAAAANESFRRAAKECADEIMRNIATSRTEDNVIGLYVRGSIAHGRAVAGVSDVDLIVVAKRRVDEDAIRDALRQNWLPKWNNIITKADVRYEYVNRELHDLRGDELLSALSHCDVFVLATQSVTLLGLDLPKILPSGARVPQERVLRTLSSDVEDALSHGSQRAYVWCLKRLVRAAYEKFALRNSETAYTRDLYYCVELAIEYADVDVRSDLATALLAIVQGPEAVWGALWPAYGAATCQRLERKINGAAARERFVP